MSADATAPTAQTARPAAPDGGLPRGVAPVLRLSGLAPYHLLGAPLSRFVVERNMLLWRGQVPNLLAGVFEPLLYLLVLGVGVGGLVGEDPRLGASYGEFVAAGLLGAAAMNATVYETYNVFFKLNHEGLYAAIAATPAGPRDMALGEIVWGVGRVALYAVGFLGVAAALGLLTSPLALLALPIALLIGVAFGGVTLAATTFMRSWHDFDLLQVAVIPMFLFSATFYPLEVLPGWAQAITQVSPLYHGVAALRQVMLGTVAPSIVGHLAVLVLLGWVGARVGARRFERLLRT